MRKPKIKITFFGAAAGIIAVTALAVGVCQAVLGQETESPPRQPVPGATRDGTLVYDGATLKVEYPDDWILQVGDFGSFDNYGVLLISPDGTEVFVHLNTRQVRVTNAAPSDAQDVDFLLETGVVF